VFKFSVLETANKNALLQSEIEHVTPYIKDHPEKYKMGNCISEINYKHYRWTLDNKEDYEFISEIYKRLFKMDTFIKWQSVIDLLEENKDLVNINSHISRNEGFTKSLNEDRKIK
jgi:spore coat polysaccharide biosynthesis protein SpsF